MKTLSEAIADPERKRAVVRDAETLLDGEVAAKSGLSGLAVKAAFGLVKAVKPGIIPEVIDGLLPDFAKALEPIFATRPEAMKPGAHLLANEPRVVQALLSVTDERAERTTHRTLLGAYRKLRPAAEKHVAQALPQLAKLVDRHCE